ncbi:MAG: hypothetical protein ACODAE_06900 [Gemmatimonadota bacterium]
MRQHRYTSARRARPDDLVGLDPACPPDGPWRPLDRRGRPLPVLLLLLLAAAAALVSCAIGGAGDGALDEVDDTRPDAWTVGVAEHIALWYHGLAYLEAPGRTADDAGLPPRFRADYVDSIGAVKRRRGAYPTPLDERAAEFRDVIAGDDAYDPLQFLPLYFRDAEALFSSVELWVEAGGDPRRAGSRPAAEVITFLSRLFPGRDERRVVGEWTEVVRAEREAFYGTYWSERGPALAPTVSAVQRGWDGLAPVLRDFLDYMRLEGGDLLLVPAIGPEGRIITAGPTPPRAAVLVPPARRPGDALWSFVHELMYPLVDDVIRDYVAPVRIRELGLDVLGTRAAVRGGAMVLERVGPERVEAYRRFFLRSIDERAAAVDDAEADVVVGDEASFERAFPLPPELERGLRETIEQALAGI